MMPDRISPHWRLFWRTAYPLLRGDCSLDELLRLEKAAFMWHRDVQAKLRSRRASAGKDAA